MGSIPVRSTRNSRVIKYVGCFFMSFRSGNRTMVRPPARRARPFCRSILRISDISPVIGGIYPSGVPENGECSLASVIFFCTFVNRPRFVIAKPYSSNNESQKNMKSLLFFFFTFTFCFCCDIISKEIGRRTCILISH